MGLVFLPLVGKRRALGIGADTAAESSWGEVGYNSKEKKVFFTLLLKKEFSPFSQHPSVLPELPSSGQMML